LYASWGQKRVARTFFFDVLVQGAEYEDHPLWSSCIGSTLKFCNLLALREMEEDDDDVVLAAARQTEKLLSVEKLGPNVFVLRVVTSRREAAPQMRKGGKSAALEAMGDWMARYPTTYVEWAPKHILAASLELLPDLLSPRDGAVSSLTTRRSRSRNGGAPQSPSSSETQSPSSSSSRSDWRGSDDNGYSYEAAANDLLSMTSPRDELFI
jgi:hypothetical protein